MTPTRQPAPAGTKKPYSTPRLAPLGSVAELSRRFEGTPSAVEAPVASAEPHRRDGGAAGETGASGRGTHGARDGAPP
jgi:hypothetical protein